MDAREIFALRADDDPEAFMDEIRAYAHSPQFLAGGIAFDRGRPVALAMAWREAPRLAGLAFFGRAGAARAMRLILLHRARPSSATRPRHTRNQPDPVKRSRLLLPRRLPSSGYDAGAGGRAAEARLKAYGLTDERMALLELVEKEADADLVREMLAFAAERLMELEAEAAMGAPKGARSLLRTTSRNGYRGRLSRIHDELNQQRKDIDRQIQDIEKEFAAVDAYERVRKGQTAGAAPAGGKRRTGMRENVLIVVKRHPGGVSRADILQEMNAKGDKRAEQSISNALSNLKKQGAVSLDQGQYTAAA